MAANLSQNFRKHPWLVSVLAMAAALAVRWLLDPWLHDSVPYLTFLAAVALAGLLSGTQSALVTMLLAVFASDYFFVPPRHQFGFATSADAVGMLLFIGSSLAVLMLARTQTSALQQAEKHLNDLQQAYARAENLRNQLEGIFRASPVGILSFGLDRTVNACNDMAEKILGWRAGEILGKKLPVPESAQSQWLGLQQILNRGEVFVNVESRRLRKDGSEFDALISGAPLRDANGQISGFIGAIADNTEAKRLQQELKEIEERQLLALETTGIGTWTWDIHSNSVWPDTRCRQLFGLRDDARFTYDAFMQRMHPEDRESTRATLQAALQPGAAYDTTHRMVWEDGSVHWLRCKGRVNPASPGHMLGISYDVTELKRSQEAMRSSERLAAAARLAHLLAHEVNNPLEGLGNVLYLLQMDFGTPQQRAELLSTSQELFDRITRITKQLLALYSAPQRGDHLNLSGLLDEVVAEHSSEAECSGISISREYPPDIEWFGVKTDLKHVLYRLFQNAMENAVKGGKVRLRLAPCRDWGPNRREGVRIVIADDGPGIPPDQVRTLFQPFSSTKAAPGAGLGLWVAQTIVTKHGGSIRCRSNTVPGRSGTCFSLFLRNVSGTAQASLSQSSAVA